MRTQSMNKMNGNTQHTNSHKSVVLQPNSGILWSLPSLSLLMGDPTRLWIKKNCLSRFMYQWKSKL